MRTTIVKLFRLLIVLTLVVGGSWLLFQFATSAKSYQGFVNGKIIHLRPPIKGQLSLENISVGLPLHSGQLLGNIENDRSYELVTEKQKLEQALSTNRKQLEILENRVTSREARLAKLQHESHQQKGLRLTFEHNNVAAVQAELDQAVKDAKRYENLAKKGYAPVQQAEEKLNAMKKLQAKLGIEQAKAAAAQADVQVDGSMNKGYADQRIYEIETELLYQASERERLMAEAETLTSQLAQLEESLDKLKNFKLEAPVNGVVWSLGANNNEYVTNESEVVQILDCDHLWIDTYVNEQQVSELDYSKPVDVKLISQPELGIMKGEVILVRTGVGRVEVNEGVALPKENQKSQAMVRVSVAWPKRPDAHQSCYVGSSVETTFAKKPFQWGSVVLPTAKNQTKPIVIMPQAANKETPKKSS
jgi:multidrug resistance efflux pump